MMRDYAGSKQGDLFLMIGDSSEVENLKYYRKNGFHPVDLGQILPLPGTCVDPPNKEPRYRIMVKIGFGAFSTVWLARDLDENRWVAVKICCGVDAPQRSREASILSELRETGQGKAGFEHVLQLFDDFVIKGPNGFHECLITEVVAPLTETPVLEWCSIDAVRQITQGFAFLHEQGISHGDPYISNFGVALPQLEELDEEDVAGHFPTQIPFPVMSRHERVPLANLPAYAATRESLVWMLKEMKLFPGEKKLQIKILDFGRAHKTSEEAMMLKGSTPAVVRPPEILVHNLSNGDLQGPWSQAADVWVIACTIFKAITGRLLGNWTRLDDCLAECLELGGPPVESWLDFARSKLNLKPDARRIETLMLLVLVRHRIDRERAWERFAVDRRWIYEDEQVQVFFDFLKKMIVTDPEKRISMQEALAHPFLLYDEFSIPRQVVSTTRRNKLEVPAEIPIIDWEKSPTTEVWDDEEQYVFSGMSIGWDDDKKS